jgi:hypothetical protein
VLSTLVWPGEFRCLELKIVENLTRLLPLRLFEAVYELQDGSLCRTIKYLPEFTEIQRSRRRQCPVEIEDDCPDYGNLRIAHWAIILIEFQLQESSTTKT